ncbi:MAG: hypothetical protein KGL39_34125 [Patescibacteria group bacterium]|nr:hypothetical protein [Patescibacteria group bacterium]
MFGNYNTFYPADEHYSSAAFENAKQLIGTVRSLVNFKATNTGAAIVWLALWDDKPVTNPATDGNNDHVLLDLVPLSTPGAFQTSTPHGQDLRLGLWVGAYTTAALALAGGAPDAGNVMFYRADYSAAKVLPQV